MFRGNFVLAFLLVAKCTPAWRIKSRLDDIEENQLLRVAGKIGLKGGSCKPHEIWVFSKTETDRICRQVQCRAYSARVLFGIDFPALPGWADVWRSALRALHLWRSLPSHFSLNLPQASHLLGMTKGRVVAKSGLCGGKENCRSLGSPGFPVATDEVGAANMASACRRCPLPIDAGPLLHEGSDVTLTAHLDPKRASAADQGLTKL